MSGNSPFDLERALQELKTRAGSGFGADDTKWLRVAIRERLAEGMPEERAFTDALAERERRMAAAAVPALPISEAALKNRKRSDKRLFLIGTAFLVLALSSILAIGIVPKRFAADTVVALTAIDGDGPRTAALRLESLRSEDFVKAAAPDLAKELSVDPTVAGRLIKEGWTVTPDVSGTLATLSFTSVSYSVDRYCALLTRQAIEFVAAQDQRALAVEGKPVYGPSRLRVFSIGEIRPTNRMLVLVATAGRYGFAAGMACWVAVLLLNRPTSRR